MKRQSLWKKAVSVALTAALLSGVSACGNDGGSGGGDNEGSGGSVGETSEASDAGGESGKSEQGGQEGNGDKDIITLTVLGSMGGTDGVSTDDPIGQYIMDELGIVLEYTQVSNDRLKVMAAGGDLPDIVMLHEAPEMVQNLIDAGALWAMDEWLENNGDNLKAKLPEALKYSKEVVGQGTTYFLPTEVQIANPESPNKNGFVGFFTRWDYYKELGYPEINTEDEYLDVLKQMVEAHPTTADGKKVYALSGWIDWGLWPYKISYPFCFGYTNLDNNQLYDQVNDKLEDQFLDEDGVFWRALAFFNKAYRMGLMDPEAFTMKAEQYDAKLKNGEVLVAAYNWCQPDTEVCGEEAGMYMLPGPFPYIAQIYPIESSLGYMTTNALVISANCEHPEKAMELFDYLNSDEGARLVRSGIPGEDWDVVDGVPQLIGTRLENFLSGDTVEPGYAKSRGLGTYVWLTSQTATNPAADGYPLDLTTSKEYNLQNVKPAEKDFSAYYTDGKAQYPGEAYVQMVEDGRFKTLSENVKTGRLMESVSDESAKIFNKADEYFQANIAKIITCADEAAFAAQKEKMINDVKAMGYEAALAEQQEKFEKAKETVKSFE